jgi:hypothetical protein
MCIAILMTLMRREGVLWIGNPRTLMILGNTWWQNVVNTKKVKFSPYTNLTYLSMLVDFKSLFSTSESHPGIWNLCSESRSSQFTDWERQQDLLSECGLWIWTGKILMTGSRNGILPCTWVRTTFAITIASMAVPSLSSSGWACDGNNIPQETIQLWTSASLSSHWFISSNLTERLLQLDHGFLTVVIYCDSVIYEQGPLEPVAQQWATLVEGRVAGAMPIDSILRVVRRDVFRDLGFDKGTADSRRVWSVGVSSKHPGRYISSRETASWLFILSSEELLYRRC